MIKDLFSMGYSLDILEDSLVLYDGNKEVIKTKYSIQNNKFFLYDTESNLIGCDYVLCLVAFIFFDIDLVVNEIEFSDYIRSSLLFKDTKYIVQEHTKGRFKEKYNKALSEYTKEERWRYGFECMNFFDTYVNIINHNQNNFFKWFFYSNTENLMESEYVQKIAEELK